LQVYDGEIAMSRTAETRPQESRDVLDRALGAWRADAADRAGRSALSDAARRAVLRGSIERDGATDASPSRLFPIVPWRALAWTAPAVLVAVLVIPIALGPTGDAPGAAPVDLRVAKIDGKVVFTIQNGGTPHTVSKSSDPGRFDSASAVPVTDGAFEDDAQAGPALVFYSIE
jgi:hypothetical protein